MAIRGWVPCLGLAGLAGVAGLAGAAPAVAQTPWAVAVPGYEWSFPLDHGPHAGYRTEWWYFTGQLSTARGGSPRFGYQFTVFKVGIVPRLPEVESSWTASDVLMAHVAVTDLENGRHVFSEVVRRAVPLLAEFGSGPFLSNQPAPIARVAAPGGTDGQWWLEWTGTGFAFHMTDVAAGTAFHLTATPPGPPVSGGIVFQGPNGFSRKANTEGHASMYYSMPRLATEGEVTIDGTAFQVVGDTWMDHEFSSDPLAEEQVGWDWHSVRLDDGRALMAFLLRDGSGRLSFKHATLVGSDGSPQYLAEDLWTARALRTWTSGVTGGEYPVEWQIDIPSEGLSLRIEPLVDEQENVSRLIDGLFYWEGAVRASDLSGAEVGRGYLELTGYGTSAPPAL